jgi:hypothetical protein
MRGYPILNDDLKGRLEDLEKRTARLEKPHDIRYAQRFGWVVRSTVTSQPVAIAPGSIADENYLVMTGPSLVYVVQGVWAGTTLQASIDYQQIYPTPATSSVTLATASIAADPSVVGTMIVDVAASGVQGTYGRLTLTLDPSPDPFAGYLILDSGFITPEYEIFDYTDQGAFF